MASQETVVNPEWRKSLNESISKSMNENKDSITYSLSTLAPSHPYEHVNIPGPVPQARFVVHRGFVNERRSPPDGSENPVGPEACTMLVTTDIRTPKVTQISQGDWVQICWWMEPTGEQYRITAKGYILPPPFRQYDGMLANFPGAELAPPSLGDSFHWESERQRIFRKMSPPLKASFCRPTPGTPLTDDIDPSKFPTELPDPDKATGKEKELVQQALDNFALIVLDPVFVDVCRLKVVPNERVQWVKQGNGTWNDTAVVA